MDVDLNHLYLLIAAYGIAVIGFLARITTEVVRIRKAIEPKEDPMRNSDTSVANGPLHNTEWPKK